MTDSERTQLIRDAAEARRNAMAPYSRFEVGAALKSAGGKIYRGCNVENGTYGLSMCAERVALFSALASGERSFTAIAVVAPSEEPITLCGACRQLLWEFCGDVEVLIATLDGAHARHRLSDLLPHPFEFGGPV